MVLRPALQNEGYDQLALVNLIDTMHASLLVALVLSGHAFWREIVGVLGRNGCGLLRW